MRIFSSLVLGAVAGAMVATGGAWAQFGPTQLIPPAPISPAPSGQRPPAPAPGPGGVGQGGYGQPAPGQQQGQQPGQRPPAQPQRPAQPAAPAAPQAAPAETPAVDDVKIARPIATFSGLDKITGRITSFDVAIDETVQFGALQVTPRVCYARPPTVAPLTTAFVEVDEVTLENKIRRIFTGWMFADSPGLHAVEHAVYDVWLTACKAASPEIPTPAPRQR